MIYYPSTIEGKKTFVEEVLSPLVKNEGYYADCEYEQTQENGELIVLVPYSYDDERKREYINVSGDSIEAVCRDFMRGFLRTIGG